MKQQARNLIIHSFKELLNKHAMDKLTVKEICTQCGVNRQTFYYYFEDIMGIFKAVVTEELSEDIAQNKTLDTWQGGFLTTMNYLKRNSVMVLHVYNSSFRQEVTTFATNFSNQLLNGVVDECAKKLNVKLKAGDQHFIVNLYRHIFNGLMIDWMSQGMEEDPQMILRKLQIIIRGSIPRSIEDFSKELYKG